MLYPWIYILIASVWLAAGAILEWLYRKGK